MQKLAVVYFLKSNLDNINSFREKYDPNWHIIPPHITMISPLSGIFDSQLIEHIENVTKDIDSFSIHLGGLTKTSDDCLFLLVKEGNEKIINLHDTLYSGILTPYLPTDYPFVPHLTLGCFIKSDNTFDKVLYAKAYAEAKDFNFDITCPLDAILVIKGDGVSPAKIVKTINLQS